MGEVKLNTPRLRIVREGHDDLEVQTTNADLVLWDRTRYRHKWPLPTDAPTLWVTFLGWAAARRTGAIPPELKYETWESEVLANDVVEDEEDEEGSPTNPDPGPD